MSQKIERSFPVTYDDGSEVRVRRCKTSQLDNLIELQQLLLEEFFYCGRMMGSLLRPSNTKVWDLLRRVAALLPLTGADGEFLDVDRIADNSDEIARVFFTTTTTIDEDGSLYPNVQGEPLKPSEIAILNGLVFFGPDGLLGMAYRNVEKRHRQRLEEIQTEGSQDSKPEPEVMATATENDTESEPLSPNTKKTRNPRKSVALTA